MVSVAAAPHSGQVIVELRIIGASDISIAEVEHHQAEQDGKGGRSAYHRARANRSRNTITRLPLAPKLDASAGEGGGRDREQRHAVGCRNLRDAAKPRRPQASGREQDRKRAAGRNSEGSTEPRERE